MGRCRRAVVTLGPWPHVDVASPGSGGIVCLCDSAWVGNDPDGLECLATMSPEAEHAVILAFDDCPGECMLIEVDS